MQYLTWSPQGDAYAYVYRCNIFYKPGIKSSKVYPITTDGTQKTEDGPIYNGIPDWVYEGNILYKKRSQRSQDFYLIVALKFKKLSKSFYCILQRKSLVTIVHCGFLPMEVVSHM